MTKLSAIVRKDPEYAHGNSASVVPAAFTLVELLVVMAIMALLATISVPALKSFGKGTSLAGAQRQLLDDIGLARLRAISGRTTVYLVFVPPTVGNRFASAGSNPVRQQLTNLFSGQFTSYALLAKRTVGDQPGRERARYISEWKRLPERMLIAPYKFINGRGNDPGDEYNNGFDQEDNGRIPFPRAGEYQSGFRLPVIAFNAQGQLSSGRDELIPLAEGSVFFPRTAAGAYDLGVAADVEITPRNNYTNNYIRIDWLTGRASVDQLTRPKFAD